MARSLPRLPLPVVQSVQQARERAAQSGQDPSPDSLFGEPDREPENKNYGCSLLGGHNDDQSTHNQCYLHVIHLLCAIMQRATDLRQQRTSQ